mgnify:CR=1 FL=1
MSEKFVKQMEKRSVGKFITGVALLSVVSLEIGGAGYNYVEGMGKIERAYQIMKDERNSAELKNAADRHITEVENYLNEMRFFNPLSFPPKEPYEAVYRLRN